MPASPPVTAAEPRRWRFGRVSFDEASSELRVDGAVVEVERKPLDVLSVLLDQAGKVVTKSQLVQLAWPGRVIGDAALAKAIARLREAIGDADHQIVRTHHRYGYRLIADARAEAEASVAPSTTAPKTAPAPVPPIPESPPAKVDAEHRVLTMLFCDLVGSTELAESLEPETFRDLLVEYQRSTAEIVQRYEGHIAQQFGDGMLFYFGYPVANDDDAERAVRCACELLRFVARTAVFTRAAIRIGLHTGPVLVGQSAPGSSLLATGAHLHIASRLQSLAEPNTILISDATFRLVPGLFVTRDFGPQSLRGLAEPMRVHQVLQPSGVRSRLDAQPRLTPFVGREAEMSLADSAWRDAIEGQGRAVVLVGEPGMGKSRLLLELRARLTGTPYTWLEARADALNRHSAFHVLAELLRRGLSIDPAEEDEQRLRALERRLDDLGIARESSIPLLAALLDLPESTRYPAVALPPEIKRARTLDWLVDWISRLADVQPLVMVVEDLHWCDDSTLEFVGRVIAHLDALPLLLVMTARPEFTAPWPNCKQAQIATLEALPRPDVEHMLAQLSEGEGLPPALRARVIERAGGVPLFVEELARVLLETGAHGADAIPGSLDSLLRARLDRLGTARDLIQAAAVIGMQCERPLLQRVSGLDAAELDARLARLGESGLLLTHGERHVFKHALIRDSAYGTLLKSSAQKLHARTADAIEALYAGRLDERCGELAYHCERAGQNERAAQFAQRAGEQALRRSANTEAAVQLSTAIRLREALPCSPEHQRKLMALYSTLGVTLTTLHGYTDSRALGSYQRALALARELGDTTELGPMMAGLGAYHMVAAEYAKAVEILQELTDVSVKLQMPIARIAATFLLGQTLFCMGRFREAVPVLEESLALYQRDAPADMALLFQEDSYSSAMATLAITRWSLGFPERSAAESRASLQHARRVRHPFSLAIACNLNAYAHQLRGDVESTIALANENIALSSAQNFPFYVAWSQLLLAWTEVESGKAEAAIAEVREASQIFNGNGAEFFRSWALLVLAEAQARAGRVEDALASIGNARDVAVRKDEGTYLAEIHRLRGEFLLKAGHAADEAESEFVRAIEIARAQAALSWELRAAMSLARLRVGQGRKAEALAILQPVYARFTEGFDTPDLITARTLLAELT